MLGSWGDSHLACGLEALEQLCRHPSRFIWVVFESQFVERLPHLQEKIIDCLSVIDGGVAFVSHSFSSNVTMMRGRGQPFDTSSNDQLCE